MYEQKIVISTKEEEIIMLKNNSKVCKFHDLELKMNHTLEENNILKEQFDILKNSYAE